LSAAPPGDPLATLDANARATLASIGDRLIPAADGMPSAGEVVGDDRLRFVLVARPDLVEPLRQALRPGRSTSSRAARRPRRRRRSSRPSPWRSNRRRRLT